MLLGRTNPSTASEPEDLLAALDLDAGHARGLAELFDAILRVVPKSNPLSEPSMRLCAVEAR